MLSVFSVVLFGACSFAAVAADSTNTQTSNATEAVRAQVEKQRDQLSGVDKVAVKTTQTSSAVLDAPVDTGDAPALVQKP
ncbi:hypothetical protein OKW98_15880 [Pseudomonas sp. KU26590]|uniref:hypothetical protein n=1 Tax=Pseudomonas sp. KU26590 TaxID=2991051 RepID=UPI00223DAD3A|nr:hypothetical protein [Pseudomonas sp. KU26590]UZJ58090.1 hypothetical protein OKW98_15880 [Pseudomonas sp. KU26590]